MRKYFALLVLGLLAACVSRISPTGVSYEKISFRQIDGWYQDDFAQAYPALIKSCTAPAPAWHKFCEKLHDIKEPTSASIRKLIEYYLTPYQVYANGQKEGRFTGYYEAFLKGSPKRTSTYTTPIYGIPADLVKVDLSLFGVEGQRPYLMGRVQDGRLVPYYTRQQITDNAVKEQVIAWVDPVDAFMLHIQGSGRVQMDNQMLYLNYAADNGHKFVGIGQLMKQQGLLEPGKASMPDIRQWLKQHPKQAQALMNQNPRYIFFKSVPEASGPIGAAGVSLTPLRSMAVDSRYITLNTPIFLNTTDPDGRPLRRLVVAQDVGSAITGEIRGDYFWGYGEEAFEQAGRMNSAGSYVIFWPKEADLPIQR